MRAVVSVVVLAVLTAASCKSKASSQNRFAAQNFPAVACSTLTDADVAQLIKVLPTFNAALKAAKWSPIPPKENLGPVGSLVPYIDGMNVPGVDESLKTAGTDWGTMRSTLYKVFAAHAAVVVGSVTPQMIEQLNKDTSQFSERRRESFQAMKGACAKIPPGNVEIVKNHAQELQALYSIGR